ncbi:hypothetical protein MTP06_26910 [Streptomyces sp. PLM4]|nr:hypothetical protein MTP06_26910 [Streptomyces sp. PLM4]
MIGGRPAQQPLPALELTAVSPTGRLRGKDMHMRGKAVAAGAVATLAMVAGVTYWAVSGDDEPFAVSGYKAMCQKPREYTEAAPHAGSGPRPVYIDGFWPLTDTDAKELNASSEAATTTHSWAPPARTPSPCTSIHTRSSPTTAPATSPPPPPPPQRSRWPPAGNRE